MTSGQIVPTARDIMSVSLVTLAPELPIMMAIRTLLRSRISGAPVVDASGKLIGILSELDCLRMLASDEFFHEGVEESGRVREFMTPAGRTVQVDTDIYSIAHHFLTQSIRRLPVLDRGRLVGQVSRRDVLRGIDEMSRKRTTAINRKRYPDYRQPAPESGPSR